MKRKALITGITGQDGSYLADLLLEKNYEVHAIMRRSSVFTTQRIDHIFDKHERLFIYHGDLNDSSNLHRLLMKIRPDEIYNLGAQSHVAVSFDVPEYTADVVALGAIRLLDVLRDLVKTNAHLLIEKPLCTTVEDCLEFKKLANGYPGVIWTAMEYRYMPPVARFIEEVHKSILINIISL